MKDAIIKSVTAVLCVIALCITSSVAVGNYTEALKESAKLKGSVSTGGAITPDSGEIIPDAGEVTPDAGEVIPDAGEVTPDVGEVTPDAGEVTPDAGETTPDAGVNKPTANDPTKYTTEQVVKYYKEVMNKSFKAPQVTVKRTETIDISVDEVKPGGDIAADLASKIIDAYAKTTEYSGTFKNGFDVNWPDSPTENFVYPIQLDPKGAKTGTVTKKGNGYEINILVKAETATLDRFPVYNKQCSTPLDLSTVDLFGLEITQADFSYPGTKLKAIVNEKGYVTYSELYMPMSGTGGGKFLVFSATAKVSGSMKRTATYTY